MPDVSALIRHSPTSLTQSHDPWIAIDHDQATDAAAEISQRGELALRIWRAKSRRAETSISRQDVRQRLDNVNLHFARKADEVFIDAPSLELLASLYASIVVPISEVDVGEQGTALARLAAANFCEVGANVIYVTEAGQRFVESIMES